MEVQYYLADPALTSLTLVTTCLAAAAGGIALALTAKAVYGTLDITMFMNGVLGGLVGITAGADLMSPAEAIAIGAIAGPIVLGGVALLDKAKLDDPVGAIPVHLFCGMWGTLLPLVSLVQSKVSCKLGKQAAVIGIAGLFCCVGAVIIVLLVKALVGLGYLKLKKQKVLTLQSTALEHMLISA